MNLKAENSYKEFEFTREDFDYLRQVVNETTGIVSSEDKYTMYYSRLARRLRTLGLSDFRSYREFLQQNPETESIELVNSVTTNLTSFYREKHHFEFLRDRVIADMRKQGDRRLRIWSAGCASGEEAYSIAMTLAYSIPDIARWDVRILASDIDSQVLATAKDGLYDRSRVDQIDAALVGRFFVQATESQCGQVRVCDSLRHMVEFKQLNLLHQWPFKEKFDLIFCRNVVIYFDRETKTSLVERFADQLLPRGYLLMGHSESLYKTTNRFTLLGKTVYQLSDGES